MLEIVVGKIEPFVYYSVLIWVHIPESLMALLHKRTHPAIQPINEYLLWKRPCNDIIKRYQTKNNSR